MMQVYQYLQSLQHNVVRCGPVDIGNKTQTTGIAFVAGIVQTLG